MSSGMGEGPRPQGIGYEVHGDRKGSLPVFERQWREMLAAEAEPEFGPQERLFAERKIEALLEILPPPPATMLECGCGSAEVSAALAAQGYRATLLDAAPAALQVARRRFARRGLAAEYTLGNVPAAVPGGYVRCVDEFWVVGAFRRRGQGDRGDGARDPAGRDVLCGYRAGAVLGADGGHGALMPGCGWRITA
ncbi:MAG: class I SAM-dependent methyltransferase [Chloroflexia bacterium]